MSTHKESETSALHINMHDGNHVVAVKSLKVLLSKDGDSWFAQGLEIDYASAGNSVAEAKKNFESGLEKTVAEHLKMHGTIENFLNVAPPEAWKEYYEADASALKQMVSMLQFHSIRDEDEGLLAGKLGQFPFKQIEFLEQISA